MSVDRNRILTLGALLATVLLAALVGGTGPDTVAAVAGNPATYTLDADFDEGTLVNINHIAPNNDQLQLDSQATPFEFIWVAASGRGTIVKIDTVTGNVLGEYWSAPQNMRKNPSRTTVDGNGNVWAGNRDESVGWKGSVVHVGLEENGQCVDRNGNGVIDTSSGLSDIKPWPNTGGADTNGGVSTAVDECIIHYVRTKAYGVRTVAVDANNDVWVGGTGNRWHELVDGATGVPVPGTQINYGCGGYGGLLDGNGVLWSAGFDSLLWYDPGTSSGTCLSRPRHYSYGLGIDSSGSVWNSNWSSNSVTKYNSDGSVFGWYFSGGSTDDRGVTVTPDDNVWVANSRGRDVSRLLNDGTFVTMIYVGWRPTGLAVDAAGKVWVTNHDSDNAMRIDPSSNSVDLTVSLGSGARPYNYSDMTGSTLIAPPNTGTWTIVHDSGIDGATWGRVTWSSLTPGDSSLAVMAASSTDGVTFGPAETVSDNVDLTVADGRYLRVSLTFSRATTGETPVLYDLTILANRPPDCSNAGPSLATLWPPSHGFNSIDVIGVTDPDGDSFTIAVDSIHQDEPCDSYGDGSFTPDGDGVGTTTAEVRAERMGGGNGRYYHIGFTATDEHGDACSGSVSVTVPHDKKSPAIDDGPTYDSTALAP